MRAVIVALVLMGLLFTAYVIWMVTKVWQDVRKERRQREKEREAWADRMMGDNDET